MANLSNINNKLVVTTDGAALINQGTVDYGTAKLQVSGNGSTGTITWRNDGGRKTGYLYSDSTGVGIYTTALNNAGIYLADNLRIDFRVNGSERMRITPDGNSTFLIIKATPSTYSSSAFLSLYGTNSNTYGGSLVSRATIQAVTDGTAFGTKLKLLTNNASNVETLALTIDASQNVGIGTTLPTTALTIRKAIASQTYGEQASMIEFKSYFPAYDTETVKSAIYSGVSSQLASQTSKGFMSFWTSSQKVGGGQNLTEKMRIEADGKVGIGEDVPLKPLHVYAPDNGGNIRLTRAGTSEYKDISTYYSLTTGNESILGTTSAHNTFLWTNNYPALRITTAQEVCLLGFVGGDGFVLPQDQNTGYSNFAAGGFGVLFREAADNYIVGNAYYYRTGGASSWKAKYASGGTMIASNVGEITFQTATSVAAGATLTFDPKMIIKNNGNVEIGNSSNSQKLSIKDSQDSSLFSGLVVERSANTTGVCLNAVGGALNLNTNSSMPIKFRIGNSSMQTINTDGGRAYAANASGLNMKEYGYNFTAGNGVTVDLFENTSAHSDITMVQISITAYHSSRTFFAGMGTFGGYGMALTGAGIGMVNGGLTSTITGTGTRKLQWTNSSGYNANVKLYIQIRTESGITVLNGTLSTL